MGTLEGNLESKKFVDCKGISYLNPKEARKEWQESLPMLFCVRNDFETPVGADQEWL